MLENTSINLKLWLFFTLILFGFVLDYKYSILANGISQQWQSSWPRRPASDLRATMPLTSTSTQPTTSSSSSQPPEDHLDATKMKTILYFTPYFHLVDYEFGFGNRPFHEAGCPVTNCFTTSNRTLLGHIHDFDAVIFHIRDIDSDRIITPNQTLRRINQNYVMFLMESPLNDNFPYDKIGRFFNWTMTYRRDSDFVRPYGWLARKENASEHVKPPTAAAPRDFSYPQPTGPELVETVAMLKRIKDSNGSSVDVAWIVSNCETHSEREALVRRMQQFIPVDVYGSCPGSLTCPHGAHCMKLIEKRYKFYLSFENSVCDDYITEKFWKTLNWYLVPVVLGGGNYSAIAPAKSFIDAQAFESAKHLADYLRYLSSNDTAYAEYFQWKKHFDVIRDKKQVFCDLCQALNEPRPKHSYENLEKWWRSDAHCIKTNHFYWSEGSLEKYANYVRNGASQIISLFSNDN